jgi:hypothetical protein
LISALVSAGFIQPTLTYTSDEIAKGLQDFLICIEMFGFAIAHHTTFGVADFLPNGRLASLAAGNSTYSMKAAIVEVLPGDVLRESAAFASSGLGIRNKMQKKRSAKAAAAQAGAPQGAAAPAASAGPGVALGEAAAASEEAEGGFAQANPLGTAAMAAATAAAATAPPPALPPAAMRSL